MKQCLKCNVQYLDNTLEFCLEDGARLLSTEETPTVPAYKNNKKTSAKTIAFPETAQDLIAGENYTKPTVENVPPNLTNITTTLKEKVTHQGYIVIEVAPIVLSLAHNFWQWLYLAKSNSSDWSGFLTSSNFIIWLILLTGALVTSVIALKYGRNRGFAITSLVVLAINFLLIIVPRRT